MVLQCEALSNCLAVNKAYKTLENEEGYRRCKEIIDEAVTRVEDMVKTKRKQLKKESKPTFVPEDEPEKVNTAFVVLKISSSSVSAP